MRRSCVDHACEPSRWGLRWTPPWGCETCEGGADMAWARYATPAAVALGGTPLWAMKRARGAPKWREQSMRS
eukprot:6737976-Pyramimonas_sp.AAC.1